MRPKIIPIVHATHEGKCGIGIYTAREMREMMGHPRMGGVLYDIHYRNLSSDLPKGYNGPKTNLNVGFIDVKKKAEFALNRAKAARSLGLEVFGYFGHEYAIFRDCKGEDFLEPLMKEYKRKGIITVLHPHTVLKNPEKYGHDYRTIMQGAVKEADLILAMCPDAIDTLEEVYGAPRENVMLNWHGVDMFDHDWVRPELKQKYLGGSDFELSLSAGFFSSGKLIDEGILAHKIYEEMTGKNWKYLVMGWQKNHEYVMKCFNVAKGLNMNPVMVGDGSEGDLSELMKYDFSNNKVIFYNVFATVNASRKAKVMADRILGFNESEDQVSSGELVAAAAASRITHFYSCPIAEGMSKEGAGFSVKRTPDEMAKSMAHVDEFGEKANLERASLRVATRFMWQKPAYDLVDAVASIVDKRVMDRLENLVN